MGTLEWFLLCLVLTPIFAVMNGGAAGVIMLWGFFAYKAYMNHLRQKEVEFYIYVRDHITYKEKREYQEYREERMKKGEDIKPLMEWYVDKKNKELEAFIKEQAEKDEKNQ